MSELQYQQPYDDILARSRRVICGITLLDWTFEEEEVYLPFYKFFIERNKANIIASFAEACTFAENELNEALRLQTQKEFTREEAFLVFEAIILQNNLIERLENKIDKSEFDKPELDESEFQKKLFLKIRKFIEYKLFPELELSNWKKVLTYKIFSLFSDLVDEIELENMIFWGTALQHAIACSFNNKTVTETLKKKPVLSKQGVSNLVKKIHLGGAFNASIEEQVKILKKRMASGITSVRDLDLMFSKDQILEYFNLKP